MRLSSLPEIRTRDDSGRPDAGDDELKNWPIRPLTT
jgi:hypothetical protein